MLTLILGTDWTTNRAKILQMIGEDVAQNKGGRILMVPELISHDTERRLCVVAGDTCSRFAEVLSFSRLASRVAEFGICAAPACMDNGGRVVAMASAVRQLHSRLKAYASVGTRPEFLLGLVDAVDEFKRCCISTQDLQFAARETDGSLAQKLEELALILEAYDAICEQGKCDPRDQMTWLLEELETSDFAANHVFYIDGFPDFTRQHFAILMHLIRVSENVVISMNCDVPGSTAMAFEKAGQTAQELIKETQNLGIQVDVQYIQPRNDDLGVMRNKLFQGKISSTVPNLRTYSAETVYQECCVAAESVSECVRKGMRYRDISIVCSNMSLYQNTLEMVLAKNNIPTYLSGTEDVLEKAAVSTLLSAMEAALNGFDRSDVMRYLKSALSPLDIEDCDKVENYAVMWNIQGSGWLQEWQYHPSGLGKDWDDASLRRINALNDARTRAIEPLKRLYGALQSAKKLSQQVEAVYSFFEDISLRNRLKDMADSMDRMGDNRNAQILNQLWEILLSAIEQLYDVLGKTVWDTEKFADLLKLLLTQYSVGTIPPVLDAVTIGPVSAMRCQQCKHLIVLGVQEGDMPSYGGASGVLTDYERTELRRIGVQLTGGSLDGVQAEFAEIYGVFCGAEESVSVSYSGTQPSFIFRRLSEMSGSVVAASGALEYALGNSADVAAILARTESSEIAGQLGIESDYAAIMSGKTHTLGEIGHEGVRKLYGDQLTLSASQIDRQADCRLMYFLKYGLRAKERIPATIDPAEFGTYVHAVMEETVREVMDKGGFRSVSMEETIEIAKKHSKAYAEERFADIDTVRLNYLFQRNSVELELIVSELWKEMQLSEFQPIGFEVGFGDEEEIPAIDVSGSQMSAMLRGYVDRVDLWKSGDNKYFRVVDYKTGKKDFDYCDVLTGYGLQMLLYLFALEQQGDALLGSNPIPAGVQYFPSRVPLIAADGILTDEEAEEEREKLWKRKGLVLSEEAVLKAMEDLEDPKRMPYTRRKDGSLSGDLADKNQFSMLKAYVFMLVGRMVDDIASGCVTPNPYTRGTSHNACRFCPYGMVCHSALVEGRRNYKAVSAQQFWNDVEKELSANG